MALITSDGTPGIIGFGTAAGVVSDGSRRLVVDSDKPADFEAQFRAFRDELFALNQAGEAWFLSFIEFAGGGDGHTFTMIVEFGNNAAAGVSASGAQIIPDELPDIICYVAADVEDLAIQQADAVARLPITVPPGAGAFDNISLEQTWLVGASKGNRVMGLECWIYRFGE